MTTGLPSSRPCAKARSREKLWERRRVAIIQYKTYWPSARTGAELQFWMRSAGTVGTSEDLESGRAWLGYTLVRSLAERPRGYTPVIWWKSADNAEGKRVERSGRNARVGK